ncbi:MAG TPA: sensor histidine kinase [Clostridiaceae bacterium]|nr:sensor histidine kinase [Clostridiaceae bacterium]
MVKTVEYFNNISINKKLILFFILISLVPTLVIGITSYKISESVVKEKEIIRTIRNLKDVDNLVFNYLSNKRYIAIRLSMDDFVTSLMDIDSLDEAERVRCEFEVRKLLNNYHNTEGIQSIYIFDSSGKEYTNDINKTDSYERIIFTKWYNEILTEKTYLWGDVRELNNIYTLPFYRITRDPVTGEFRGLILINIREDHIYRVYSGLEEPQGKILIVNQNNKIVSCSNKSVLGRELDDVIGYNVQFDGSQGYFEAKIGKERYLVTYYKNNIMGWNYVCLEQLSRILSASEGIKQMTFMICFLCLAVTFLFSIFLSMKITKPVNKLVNNIKEVQQGNLDVRVNFKSKDEFGLIGSAFDDMIKRLKQSIEDIYEAQRKKKEAEIRALIMQVNPHFLYNTLTSIIWMTNNNKKDEVINMVSSLSRLFRISISKGKEIILVSEELQHAESYLIIQKIRYKDEFNYEFEVDEKVKSLYMPKLLIQPLVENSIYHGIKSIESNGFIKIKAFSENGRLIVEVADNGNGAKDSEAERLNGFLSSGAQDSNYGIGIKNVDSRIKMYFGNNYGLSYRMENGFLIARITIPVLEEPVKI